MITWTASNNSSFLNGSRQAKSVTAAVRAGRNYIRNELYGEGTLTIYDNEQIVRIDRRDIFTSYRWTTDTDQANF